MPKLLEINVSRNHGATGKITEQIGLLAQQNGCDVYVAHGARYVNPSKLKSYQVQGKAGEYFHALKSLLLDADGLGSTCATHRLVKFIKSIKPDVIHLHNVHGYYRNYKVLFEYLNDTNIPVVMTLHDCWSFTGHCIHFVTANCDKWKSSCLQCPQKRSVPRSLFLDMSKRNFTLKKTLIAGNENLTIVCVSKWLENFVRQSIFKNHDIHLINNGIDLDMFKPILPKNGEKFNILCIGNPMTKDKGLYDIYKLRTMLPEEEYGITIIGLKENDLKTLPLGIKGMCRTSNQNVLVQLYSQSDVFVNPTYADTFPTTNIESLACGTPVITYRTGGSPEILSPETGIVVELGDVNALADAIKRMRKQPFSSKSCRQRAERLYNKNERFADYIRLYNSLISKR